MTRISKFILSLLATVLVAGCANTGDAYKAAAEREGVDKALAIAYVIGEHYTGTLRALNTANNAGKITPAQLESLRTIVRATAPAVQQMLSSAESAQALRDAESTEELLVAIDEAALELAKLGQAIAAIGDEIVGIQDLDWNYIRRDVADLYGGLILET